MTKFCDNCGRDKNPITGEQLRLKEVRLSDESGTALYCDDCRANNNRYEKGVYEGTGLESDLKYLKPKSYL